MGTVRNSPSVPISPGRRRLFRLGSLTLVPLVMALVLEGSLRLAGYGYPAGFFEKVRVGGREFIIDNEKFSLRFFPPRLARWPGPVMMEANKPAGVCRIFILGESAARGEPEPPYSAGRYLEALLRERFPGQKFEVVNLAVTAINSHVILPIARDCARQQGDLWIIYMGNNEMVGPFGAATVFGAKAPPASLVRLSLALQKTRVGQLLMVAARGLKGKSANASWGGMKMFLGNQLRPDDPRKEVVYRNFQRNLGDSVRAGLDSGAKVILNTVAVNLKDCPPFASIADTNMPASSRAAFKQLYADGSKAAEEGRYPEATRSFEQAAARDPNRADVQFRWAECLVQMTNLAAASQHFQLACDEDALPFRADSRINDLIREAGRKFADRGLELFDAAAALATNSPTDICGQESFYEHVHFNFDGNYRLGLAWAGQVERLLPAARANQATNTGWASQEACERELGLTDWNRESVVLAVTERLHRPPLSGQPNNARRLAALREEDKRLRGRLNRSTEAQAREAFVEALRRAPEDHWLHENYAQFLESCRDLKQATAQWQAVRELLPLNSAGHYQVGRLLELQDNWTESESALRQAVTLRPSLTEGWCELGNVHLAQEKPEMALDDYERARALEPQDATYCAFTGKALSKLNRRDEAMESYREAIRLAPELWEAHFALAEELASTNRLADAESEFEEVIRLQPANAQAHLSAGVMLARQGRFDPALQQFDETLRLEPENKLAHDYLLRVQGWKEGRR